MKNIKVGDICEYTGIDYLDIKFGGLVKVMTTRTNQIGMTMYEVMRHPSKHKNWNPIREAWHTALRPLSEEELFLFGMEQ